MWIWEQTRIEATYSWKHKHCTANFTFRVNYHYHKIHLLHECRYEKDSQCLYVLFCSTFKFYTTYIHTFLIIVKSTISSRTSPAAASLSAASNRESRWSWLRKIRRPDGPSDGSSGDHTNRWTDHWVRSVKLQPHTWDHGVILIRSWSLVSDSPNLFIGEKREGGTVEG